MTMLGATWSPVGRPDGRVPAFDSPDLLDLLDLLDAY